MSDTDGPAELRVAIRTPYTSSHTQPRRIGGAFFLRERAMDFSKLQGLVPAVIQDDESGEVLMVGFMNEEAFALTRRTGFVTFFSRTRNALWTKGETSGNRLQVRQLLADCDEDTVLVRVKRVGDGSVCHTGARTCFFKEIAGS